MIKPCECGCGLASPIANKTVTSRGWKKGQPKRFRHGHWLRAQSGPTLPQWKGGRHYQDGYVLIWQPDHPNACGSYVFEHILVAERAIGRAIQKGETVHHRNHIRDDNRPENLQVMTRSQHNRLHRLEEGRRGRPEFCSQPNCQERCHAGGMCCVHYSSAAHKRRYADPEYRKRLCAQQRAAYQRRIAQT